MKQNGTRLNEREYSFDAWGETRYDGGASHEYGFSVVGYYEAVQVFNALALRGKVKTILVYRDGACVACKTAEPEIYDERNFEGEV